MLSYFELAHILYEARVREAWGSRAAARLEAHPFPRHAGAPQHAEGDLAIAQAKALLKTHTVVPNA